MPTLAPEVVTAAASSVQFDGDTLVIRLTDGRGVSVDLQRAPWLRWLRDATPEQRAHWSLEPDGFAVYRDELDDGIEVAHLLPPYTIA